MVNSKMAANIAVITFKLVYLLNYILKISPAGVCHWVFWRHFYLYQIQVQILIMYDGNLDQLE